MYEIATHPSGARNDSDAGQLHKKSLSLGLKTQEIQVVTSCLNSPFIHFIRYFARKSIARDLRANNMDTVII